MHIGIHAGSINYNILEDSQSGSRLFFDTQDVTESFIEEFRLLSVIF
jgi:hypothetical protein